jgi:hypothetical protein
VKITAAASSSTAKPAISNVTEYPFTPIGRFLMFISVIIAPDIMVKHWLKSKNLLLYIVLTYDA